MSGAISGAIPYVPQGTLNRLRASIIWPNFTFLNVTASYTGKRGISVAFQGDSTVYIDTMTGAVTSPEPYLRVVVTAHLLKTQALGNAYKSQMESNTLLGPMTLRPDTPIMQPWNFVNCSIMGVETVDLSGADPGYTVRLGGIYPINSNLYIIS